MLNLIKYIRQVSFLQVYPVHHHQLFAIWSMVPLAGPVELYPLDSLPPILFTMKTIIIVQYYSRAQNYLRATTTKKKQDPRRHQQQREKCIHVH